MSGYASKTTFNYANCIDIVSVIASFDADGHVKPLYVRINEESLKVKSSWLKPSFQGLMEFQCKAVYPYSVQLSAILCSQYLKRYTIMQCAVLKHYCLPKVSAFPSAISFYKVPITSYCWVAYITAPVQPV